MGLGNVHHLQDLGATGGGDGDCSHDVLLRAAVTVTVSGEDAIVPARGRYGASDADRVP